MVITAIFPHILSADNSTHFSLPFENRYKSTMRLNITKIRSQDYGEYHCVSKNEMGIARAVFHLQGKCCGKNL